VVQGNNRCLFSDLKKKLTLCEQNVELPNVKLVVHIVTSGLWKVSVPRHVDASCFCYLVGVSAMTGRMSVIWIMYRALEHALYAFIFRVHCKVQEYVCRVSTGSALPAWQAVPVVFLQAVRCPHCKLSLSYSYSHFVVRMASCLCHSISVTVTCFGEPKVTNFFNRRHPVVFQYSKNKIVLFRRNNNCVQSLAP
jgi:hypothetical protein